MNRLLFIFVFSVQFTLAAETMTFSTSGTDYTVTNTFGVVSNFGFSIEIDAPLAAGVYNNPDIVSVDYRVVGNLPAGTPSGFSQFDLQRSISGAQFYAQGSSISFEISSSADLSDGVQASELVGNTLILTLNAREIGNGRFHPPLFELNADGTGRILNSNNVPRQDPLITVDFGEEYVTDLLFNTAETTLIRETDDAPIVRRYSGSFSFVMVSALVLLSIIRRRTRR